MDIDVSDPNWVMLYLTIEGPSTSSFADPKADAEMARLVPLIMEHRHLPELPSKAAHDGLILLGIAKGDSETAEHVQATCAHLLASQILRQPAQARKATLEWFVEGIGLHENGASVPYQTLVELTRDVAPAFRLRYREVIGGRVKLDPEGMLRLLVPCLIRRTKTLHLAPIPRPQGRFPETWTLWNQLQRRRSTGLDAERRIGIQPDSLPPCIRRMLSKVHNGEPVGHDERFNVAAFCTSFGMGKNALMGLFSKSRGFDRTRSEYQIDHIQKGRYRPMNCDKLRDLSLCPDATCRGPTPTLNYVARVREARAKAGSAGGSSGHAT